MGQNTGANSKGKKEEVKREQVEEEEEEEEQEEQDGVSVHSPCKPPSSSLRKEQSQVELELRLLEALEIYPPAKLREYLRRSFNKHFTADDVLKLLDRFYNLEMLKPDDDEGEILNQEEEFSLPQSYFSKEES